MHAGSGGGKSFAAGGGVIYASVEKMMELDGWIKADGNSGSSGGGGASGGTMWVAARHFEGDKKNVIIKFCPSWCFLKDILFTFVCKLTKIIRITYFVFYKIVMSVSV